MLYSEYLIRIKNEIQSPLAEYHKEKTTLICIAMDRISKKNDFSITLHQKKLTATIRSKATKEKVTHAREMIGDRMPALFFPELKSTKLTALEKRIKWLDGLIIRARAREFKVNQMPI